jgi:DNA processing protein
VVIVSGLALGVDSIAHIAALEAKGTTLAVLPSSLHDIYPRGHYALAKRLLQSGGALMSEYDQPSRIYPQQFIARNRLVAGIADLVLVTEAAIKSGTIHTTRFALEQGKDVFAVPGPITNTLSGGTNQLIKSGAGVATSVTDILTSLGIQPAQKTLLHSDNPNEQRIIELLARDIHDGAEILQDSALSVQAFNQALTMLEITGVIRALGGNQWALH